MLAAAPRMKKIGVTATFVFVCLALVWFSPMCSVPRSFDHLEQNAKKVIPGSELQAWAGQVVALYPSPPDGYMMLRRSELVAPLPKALLGLYHNPPDIFVYETRTNYPGHVRLIW